MKKTILITGIRGFLGSSLSRFLASTQKQYVLYGISRRPSARNKNIFVCDLNRPARLAQVLAKIKPSYIFHFAGGRLADDQETFKANFLTTKRLLETVKGLKLVCPPRIIIPGSAAEYGNIPGQGLITEDCLPRPLGWYGFVKLLVTDLGLFYARQGLDVVVARMFNICGTATPSGLAIGGFARQIVAIEKGARAVIKTKNLDGKRDFLDIADVCQGLWTIAQKGCGGEIYNLCSGRPSSIRALLRDLLRRSQVQGIRVEENKQDASLSFDVIGANRKLTALAWVSRVELGLSLEQTLDSYRHPTRFGG